MGLKDLKPAAGEGSGVFRGVLLALVLHPAAFVAIAIIGTMIDRREGALLVLPFIVFVGLTQWIYLGPAAWLLRRRGRTAAAKGVVIAGGLVTLVSSLCAGGMGVYSLLQVADARRIQQEAREHPQDYTSSEGVVTVVADTHFDFRRPDGTIVSLQTGSWVDYILLKKDGGYEKRSRDILKPDVRIAVDYSQERDKPYAYASTVRVYEEGATR